MYMQGIPGLPPTCELPMRSPIKNRLATLGVVCVAVALAMLASPQRANAEFLGNLVQIDVSSGENSGSWAFEGPATSDPFSWALPEALNIYSSQNPEVLLATIESINLELDGDPQVILNFAVTAGNANTAFTISSALVAFGSLTNPDSFATAAITAVDNNSNGATVTGTFAGAKAYQASYNAGNLFANLVSPVVAPTDSFGIGGERFPAVGTVQIPGSVTSIKGSFDFILTANDSASGTSRFNVVPEPSSVILALMAATGVYCAARRRNRR